MLSQLIVDLEVVRSLVSQNGKKIGEIETDIKNKSDANQNAHQDIEGMNSTVEFQSTILDLKFFQYQSIDQKINQELNFVKIVLQQV